MRQTRQRRRMIAAVPKAAVIITNPTHYSIALQYERGMDAPVCVAKGVDAVALKIREGRRRTFDSRGREPAARPRAACHRRGRPGDPD
jgi:type III secretory pathway component EscU